MTTENNKLKIWLALHEALGNKKLSPQTEYSLTQKFLLDHEAQVLYKTVGRLGTTGRINVPKAWVGRRVVLWIANDDDEGY